MSGSFLRLCLLILAATLVTGCFNPARPEQMSDWRWKQWQPDYRPAHEPP
jgi:hypothetical protein